MLTDSINALISQYNYGKLQNMSSLWTKKIPFKLGVCICGNQVGSIQYVKDSQEFAFNHDSFLGMKIIR